MFLQEQVFVNQLGTVWMKKNEIPLLEPTPIYKDDKFYVPTTEELKLPSIKHQFILGDYEDETEKERKVVLNKTFEYNDLPFTFKDNK